MQKARLWLVGLDIIFLITLGRFVWEGRARVPFHGDESTLIALSRDYDLLVHQHDVGGVVYQPEYTDWTEQRLRILNGSVSPLTIGLAWDLAGFTADDLNSGWDWMNIQHPPELQWTWNVNMGNLPGDALLVAARTPATLFTILSVVIVFVIAWQMTHSHPAAWLASLMYVTTPALLLNGRRATQEGALLFASALVMLVALHTIRSLCRPVPERGQITRSFLLLGMVSGLALASKHTGGVIVAAAYLAALLAPLVNRPDEGVPPGGVLFNRRHVYRVIGSGFIALLTFDLLMPVWWSWPFLLVLGGLALLFMTLSLASSGLRLWVPRGIALVMVLAAFEIRPPVLLDMIKVPVRILEERNILMDRQVALFGGQDNLLQRAGMLVRQAFYAEPEYFEDPAWVQFDDITTQIIGYESDGLAGRTSYLAVNATLIGLCLIGLARLFTRRYDGQALLLTLWLLAVTVTLMANPLPWQRYYIILYAPVAITVGLGLQQVEVMMVAWLRSRRKDPAAAQAGPF